MTSPGLSVETGRVLGDRYRLVAPVGVGTSARVHLAIDTQLRRRVAVKLLHEALAEDEAFLRRFRAEARAAGALSHQNIVAVFDWGEDHRDGVVVPYLVTEYLGGGSLRQVLDRHGSLTPSQALVVGLDAARALAHAHQRGLVHRDVKPANLLFDEDQRLRLADFGLARALAEASWTEPSGIAIGTARYASPEQALGRRLDGRSDVYSLALVLVECVTGQVPFAADTTAATLALRTQGDLELGSGLGGLRSILERAGRLDPAERPEAAELEIGLMAAAEELARPEPIPVVATLGDGETTTEMRLVDELGAVADVRPAAAGAAGAALAAAAEPEVVTPPPPRVVEDPDGRDVADPDHEAAGGTDDEARSAVDGAVADAGPPAATAPGTAAPATAERDQAKIEPSDPAPSVGAAPGNPEGVEGAGSPDGAGGAAQPADVDLEPARSPIVVAEEHERLSASRPSSFGPLTTDGSTGRARRWPWVVAFVVVALLAAAGAGWWFWVRVPVHDVPDLVGLPVTEAAALAEALEWTVDDGAVERRDDTVPGEVLDQDPPAGDRLAEGEQLSLVVSLGPTLTPIPDLRGVPEPEARERLDADGLVAGPTTRAFDEEVPPDAVISATPVDDAVTAEVETAGQVPRGSEVALVVSDGPAPRTVPDGLQGASFEEAAAALEAIQLAPVRGVDAFSDDVPAGLVISLSERPGTELPRGAEVVLEVSKGPAPIPVPDVRFDTGTAAVAALEGQGFVVAGIEGSPSGMVLATDPPAGELHQRGTAVRIFTRS